MNWRTLGVRLWVVVLGVIFFLRGSFTLVSVLVGQEYSATWTTELNCTARLRLLGETSGRSFVTKVRVNRSSINISVSSLGSTLTDLVPGALHRSTFGGEIFCHTHEATGEGLLCGSTFSNLLSSWLRRCHSSSGCNSAII